MGNKENCLFFFLLLICSQTMGTDFDREGYVTDKANILTRSERVKLHNYLVGVKQESKLDIAVVMVDSPGTLTTAQFAKSILQQWDVGAQYHDWGLVFLIVLNDSSVYLAPNTGAAIRLPSDFLQGILDKDVLPMLRKGEYFTGTMNGLKSIHAEFSRETFGRKLDNWNKEHPEHLIYIIVFIIAGIIIFNVVRAYRRPPSHDKKRRYHEHTEYLGDSGGGSDSSDSGAGGSFGGNGD